MSHQLSKILRELRANRGDSLRDVEKNTKISNAYLSQLERGEATRPSADKLYTLANYYGIPYQNLLAAAGYIEEGEKTKSNANALDNAWMGYDISDEEKELVLKFIRVLRE